MARLDTKEPTTDARARKNSPNTDRNSVPFADLFVNNYASDNNGQIAVLVDIYHCR